MEILLTILHLAASFILILIVLLQTGKGADLAGAFGGGGSQTTLGVRGATQMIHKLTIAAAVFFMITSYSLGLLGSGKGSLASAVKRQAEQTQGAVQDQTAKPEESDNSAGESDNSGNADESGGSEESPSGAEEQEAPGGNGEQQ